MTDEEVEILKKKMSEISVLVHRVAELESKIRRIQCPGLHYPEKTYCQYCGWDFETHGTGE